jgi:hypothetical protein
MWNDSFGKEIARVLNLMADKPNLRRDPDRGIELFDGGECDVHMGVTKYRFTDGSIANFGSGGDLEMTIVLATGQEVILKVRTTIELPKPKLCAECNHVIQAEETLCSQCAGS